MAEPAYVTLPEMRAALAELETRLTMRMFTVMLIGNGIAVAVIGVLMRMWLGDLP